MFPTPRSLTRWPAVLGVTLSLAVASGVTPLALPPPADFILRRAELVRSPDLDYLVDFKLHVVAPDTSWKEREARYTMIAHGKDHSLVLMHQPDTFYPGTLLITRGLYWLLLPRSQKSFQLSPRHVLNGDISNGDLARGNLLAYYEPRLDGDGEIRGQDCYRLELTRTKLLGLYPRIVCWIRKNGFRPLTFEYYGETGALLKVAHYEDYHKGPIGVRAMRIVVENHARPGEQTTLTFSNIREADLSGFEFNRESLMAFRDAALSALETDGERARPEDLLARLTAEEP